MKTSRNQSSLARAKSGGAVRRSVTRMSAAALLLLGMTSVGFAADCVTGTLTSYAALGVAGCTIGNLSFGDFASNLQGPTASEITVTPVSDPTFGAGLKFSADWSLVGPGQETASTIVYELTALKTTQIASAALVFNGGAFTPDGEASVTENFNAANLFVFVSENGNQEVDSATFPGETADSVGTTIGLSANGPTSSAGLSSTTNFFDLTAPVPEPSTWAMMLAGFAGLGFARYRALRRTAAIAA